MGYSPQGCKASDTTERLSMPADTMSFHLQMSDIRFLGMADVSSWCHLMCSLRPSGGVFFFFFSSHVACRIVVPHTGIEPRSLTAEHQGTPIDPLPLINWERDQGQGFLTFLTI